MIRHICALAAIVAVSLSTVACVAPTETDEGVTPESMGLLGVAAPAAAGV